MGQKFRLTLKVRASEEKGAALILVLVIVALASIIIPALLSFMAAGMKTTYNTYHPLANELYAADAGIREAMWRINNQDIYPLPSEDITTTVTGTPLTENGKNITVRISSETIDESPIYKIVSIASDPTTGHQTSIDALVFELDLTSFVDKILTSPTTVPIAPQSTITGNGHDMWLPEGWTGNNVTVDALVETNPIPVWPTPSSFIEFYSDQVDKTSLPPPYIDNGVIEVYQDMSIGPFYYEGDLVIKKANGPGVPAGDLKINLAGTVYVKGTLNIAKDITLDLYQDPIGSNPTTTIVSVFPVYQGTPVLTVISTTNFPSTGMVLVGGDNPEYLNYSSITETEINLEKTTGKVHANNDPVEVILRVPHTIFVEGAPDAWNFSSTTDCTINGPGAIIAVGGVRFQPKVDADSGFTYVMSIDGTADFQPATSSGFPSGFTGSVAAKDFNPMGRSNYTYPLEGYPLNLNIPLEPEKIIIGGISYWKIY